MRSLLWIAILAATACDGATGIPVASSPALLGTFDGDPMTLVDLASGTVHARPVTGFGGLGEEHRVFIERDSLLVMNGAGQLIGYDIRTQLVRWRETLGSVARARFADHVLWANFALGTTSDERRLLVADAYDGVFGMAVLDATTRDLLGYVPGLRVRFILPRSAAILLGADAIVFGTRADPSSALEAGRRTGQLYVLDSAALHIRDSIAILSKADSLAGGVLAMALDTGGRNLYYVTFASVLYKFSLDTRTRVAALQLPAAGPLAVAPRDSEVYVIDAGWTFESPGSGALLVARADLQSFETIDLTPAGISGVPLLNCVVTSRDGGRVYVGVGSAALGPTYGVQRGSVIVVDPTERRVNAVLPLDTWGVRSIFLLK